MAEIAYDIKASTFLVDGKEFPVEGKTVSTKFVEINVPLANDDLRLSEALSNGEEVDIIFSTTIKVGRIIKLYNDNHAQSLMTRVEIHIPEPINFNER